MLGLFHVEANSFYIRVLKIRYRGNGYVKAIIEYYSKGSGNRFCVEKNVKIRNECFKYWERYSDL